MLLGGVRSHSFSDLFELQPAGPTASRCHCPTPEVRESLPTHFAQARQSEIIIINHKFHNSCIHRPMSENKRTRIVEFVVEDDDFRHGSVKAGIVEFVVD